jgi:hypothetical protein
VIDDTAPVISQCATDKTLSADGSCQATIPDLTVEVVASDNCDASPTITQSPTAGTLAGLGATTVTLTVTDDAGNSSTCTATVTVIDDTAPVISQCATDKTLSADGSCQAAIPDLTGEVVASDNCDASLTVTQSPEAGTLVGLGATTVTLTATDDAGLTDTCTATVTVIDDTAPVISQCATDKTLSADAACQATIPDLTVEVVASDNCDASPTITQSPEAGTLVGLGATTVTLTVTDDAGNSRTCTATTTVVDDTPPAVVECPADRTLEANPEGQALVPDLTGEVIANDNCDATLTITQSPPAGTLIGLGETTVTLTVTDDAGLIDTCAATLTVVPQISLTLSGNCWHLITLPCLYASTDPWEVFDELRPPNKPTDLLSGSLHRYDSYSQSYATYYSWAPSDFGSLATGQGYWLWLFEDTTIAYGALCSGTTESVVLSSAGWHLIGSPQPEDVDIASTVWYRDADGPYSFADIRNTWVQDPLIYYSCLTQSYLQCGMYAQADDHYLRAFHGYWLYCFEPGLTVWVPPGG